VDVVGEERDDAVEQRCLRIVGSVARPGRKEARVELDQAAIRKARSGGGRWVIDRHDDVAVRGELLHLERVVFADLASAVAEHEHRIRLLFLGDRGIADSVGPDGSRPGEGGARELHEQRQLL